MLSKPNLVFCMLMLLIVSGCISDKDKPLPTTTIKSAVTTTQKPATTLTSTAPTTPKPTTTTFENDTSIPVKEEDRFCESDDDCIVVSNVCHDCGGVPINKAHKEKYNKLWQKTCADYKGPVCDWDYRDKSVVRCVNSKCVFVLKE